MSEMTQATNMPLAPKEPNGVHAIRIVLYYATSQG